VAQYVLWFGSSASASENFMAGNMSDISFLSG
jgi:hypothetical protein